MTNRTLRASCALFAIAFPYRISSAESSNYTFALIPKDISSPFFQEVFEGFELKAKQLGNIDCLFVGPNVTINATQQIDIINDLVDQNRVQGIAVSVIDPVSVDSAITNAVNAGIPVITFDSDASPSSKRLDFIGSNNTEIGIFLAKTLLQLDPDGYKNGTYGIIGGEAANLKERYNGFQGHMLVSNTRWKQASGSPKDAQDNSSMALEAMKKLVQEDKIKAFISLGGWPMFDAAGWKEFHDKYPNLTYLLADALDSQISQLKEGYANGLVGQLPFDMGKLSLDTLYQHAQGDTSHKETMVTNLVTILRVPLVLPPPNYNYHRIQQWQRIVGYVLFCICSILSLGFGITVLVFRKNKVFVASQPFFLLMICFGTLVLASAIVPLTFDDSFYNDLTQKRLNVACMSTPWLFSLGSTIIFSALFSKTWRINKIFKSARRFRRITVKPVDVLTPFMVLMVSSGTLLTVWTTLDPWVFQRVPTGTDTDEWGRIVSTYGTCKSVNESVASDVCLYLLWSIFILTLIAACAQAYQARSISIEYSESAYVAITVGWTLQMLLLATPVIVLATDNPMVVYFTKIILISLTCCPLLLLIFVPKLLAVRDLMRKEQSSINHLERQRQISTEDGDTAGRS